MKFNTKHIFLSSVCFTKSNSGSKLSDIPKHTNKQEWYTKKEREIKQSREPMRLLKDSNSMEADLAKNAEYRQHLDILKEKAKEPNGPKEQLAQFDLLKV